MLTRGVLAGGVLAIAHVAAAQQPPANGGATGAADDTPSIRVGITLFADYTFTDEPETVDAAGNSVNVNGFNIGRSYINVTGQISHLVAFRVTPDIVREISDDATNGSLTFRLKYAYAQVNLGDWLPPGSWVRLGMQQTAWVTFEEDVYRYRFQGPVFPDEEGYVSSSDAGAAFHYEIPSGWGDVHAGVYNGETYSKPEVNDEKSIQIRGTFRPFNTRSATLHGLRATGYYHADEYFHDASRRRALGSVTLEHSRVNAGFHYLTTTDRRTPASDAIDGRGFSGWLTPKLGKGWEALARFDRLVPNTALDDQVKRRTILGVAYWFPARGQLSSAFLLDYDGVDYENSPAVPNERRIGVHGLVSF